MAGEGLYIHIPFCRRRCSYCGLCSTGGRLELVYQYLDALDTEMSARCYERRFSTVFVGGGTPSVLTSTQLDRLFDILEERVFVEEGAEFSFEANPESLNEDKINLLRSRGVTRVSLGVQSFDPDECRKLGRLHTPQKALGVFRSLRRVGFDSCSLDLIAGFPGHSVSTWRQTLDLACSCEPDHISVYLYHREKNTPFDEAIGRGELEELDDALQADLYEMAVDLLRTRGYEHYEISNFARPSQRCRHNLNYWTAGSYCGVGAGAASHEQGRRFVNIADVDSYIRACDQGGTLYRDIENLDDVSKWRERLMLRLRVLDPVRPETLVPLPGDSTVAEVTRSLRRFVDLGLLAERADGFVFTGRGCLLSNEVLSEVI